MKRDQAKKVDTLKQQAIAEKQETVENLQKKLQECKSSINAYKEDIEKLTNEVENLKKKIHLNLVSEDGLSFSFGTNRLVMSLLECNISETQVPLVMEKVFEFAGLTYDKVPSKSTVSNLSHQRTIVSDIQLGEVLPKKENLFPKDCMNSKIVKIYEFHDRGFPDHGIITHSAR